RQQRVAHRVVEALRQLVVAEAEILEIPLDRVAQLVRVRHLEQGVLAGQRLTRRRPRPALQLRGGLRRERRAVLDEARRRVRAEVAGGQRLGAALEALDEGIQWVDGGVLGHVSPAVSLISRRTAARMPFTNPGAWAPANVFASSTASLIAPS